MELQTEKRFHNLTLEQVQALDKVLTEVIPIHGRGNFPTLQVRAKDIIRVVKDRLVERDIQVRDIRLNGATASHVLVRDNGLGYRDLDIIFGVELPRQEDFQVIKEVVLGSLRDLLPCGVNRRKITCLTMKEAYVQKMVKVFNEHDRWSLISLSNNRAKTVGLRFVSSLRRQFEFSVDSFQIILDRMLESYWETERKLGGRPGPGAARASQRAGEREQTQEQPGLRRHGDEEGGKASAAVGGAESPSQDEAAPALDEELRREDEDGTHESQQVLTPERVQLQQGAERAESAEDATSEEYLMFEVCDDGEEDKGRFGGGCPLVSPAAALFTDVKDPLKPPAQEERFELPTPTPASLLHPEGRAAQDPSPREEVPPFQVDSVVGRAEGGKSVQESHLEGSFPPPAKKTCSTAQDVVPDYCPSPKLQRKMSRKLITKPEKWSLLTDLSDLTTQLFPPIEIPKPLQPKPSLQDSAPAPGPEAQTPPSESAEAGGGPPAGPHSPAELQERSVPRETAEQTVKPKQSRKPPDSGTRTLARAAAGVGSPPQPRPELPDALPDAGAGAGASSWSPAAGAAVIAVEAECMFGDFQQALEHLRQRLIATHNPEEIRGGGLLKYSDLLVRNFRPASETEIKSLERYMCSRFFIDFPDVAEQQRKIEAYLQCHFIGSEEASKYEYLMTLRRVIDESTVCLMGHERRQTLNMITVLALRVLGEQNAIPNTANVTCFYQPAPYMAAEPIYNSYFVAQPQPPLVYHPYPIHVHMQTGLV